VGRAHPGAHRRARGRGGARHRHRHHLPDLRTDAGRHLLQCGGGDWLRRAGAWHVPQGKHSVHGPGAQRGARGDEKFFFAPGDLGFLSFDTPFARIGILICYDRHVPEAARVLGLGGAQIVFVPTNTTRMARYLWDVELRAHAIANVYYVCGVNKVGVDVGGSARDHHGDSLICTPRGEILAQASATQDDIVMADVDLSVIAELAGLWGYYRDRRPDLYGPVAEMPDAAVAPGRSGVRRRARARRRP
jgi:hypothetical protein